MYEKILGSGAKEERKRRTGDAGGSIPAEFCDRFLLAVAGIQPLMLEGLQCFPNVFRTTCSSLAKPPLVPRVADGFKMTTLNSTPKSVRYNVISHNIQLEPPGFLLDSQEYNDNS